jgi:LysR family transcriptional regulator, cell division regulator
MMTYITASDQQKEKTMDVYLLRVFKAVAEEESVTRAAEKLNCVQSNVTARIRQLENELETQLFFRRTRGMALSPAGKILLGYAVRVIQLINEAERAVRESDQVRGAISIGATWSLAAMRLPSILSRYHHEYPEVEITIATGTSEELVCSVLNYKLDAALVSGPVDHSGIVSKPMVREKVVVVTDTEVASVEALENPTLLVLYEGCKYRAMLENWLQQSGVVPYKIMQFGTLEGILGCVAAGMGITMLPWTIISQLNYVGKVNTHVLPEICPTMPITLIRRKDLTTGNAINAFIRIALDLYEDSGRPSNRSVGSQE